MAQPAANRPAFLLVLTAWGKFESAIPAEAVDDAIGIETLVSRAIRGLTCRDLVTADEDTTMGLKGGLSVDYEVFEFETEAGRDTAKAALDLATGGEPRWDAMTSYRPLTGEEAAIYKSRTLKTA